ncbi:MAG: DUF481 domain-containing protein [Opitutaceae bacterium]|nr:DUF481 domain-containing protein [Opitutaceae bacterium]
MRAALGVSLTVVFILWVAMTASPMRADVVETKDGTHLVGHVTKIADGKVYLDTAFAGSIAIPQSQIVRLETEAPVAVRLVTGQRYDGRLSGTNGQVQVAAATGPVSTPVSEIATSWVAGEPDPQVVSPAAHWAYEASVDLNGKSGNHTQIGSAYGVRATLTRLKDTLVLATSYDRQMTDGVRSADQFKAGADYSNNYSDKNSWYARDEGGFDHIRDLSVYNIAAIGGGYDFIKQIHQTLTGRLGLAFRYEDYTDPATTPNVRFIGLDLGLNHTLQLDNALLTTRLAIVPALEYLTDMRIMQETNCDIPLAASAWKLRLGVSNDYASRPADDIRKLDTTYFGRLVLSWK